MSEALLVGLTAVLVLGIAAQWIAWRIRIPAILVLLAAGFVAGPVTGWLDPDALLGPLLLPIVALSVGVLLFEGGLTLDVSELKTAGTVVRNLNTIGVLATWLVLGLAGHHVLGLGAGVAALLGAILVVTGPTVIGPLLLHVRPTRTVGSILRWEGILIDPIGATLAVLVFGALLAGGHQAVPTALLHLGRAAVVGGLLGLAGAWLLIVVIERHQVPDSLQSSVTLSTAIAILAAGNHLAAESGLLAVTVMGIALANQKRVVVHHIIEFKENLRVLLIGSLFILLSARVGFDAIGDLGWRGLAFLAIALFVARPLSVGLSTIGSELSWRERAFLAWLAPRGIVAAAVSSVFSLELARAGIDGAERIVPATFLIIVGTVGVYGLTAGPLARLLGVSNPDPQGVLFVGADPWVRALAAVLDRQGIPVLLADRNRAKVREARMAGLPAHFGNVLGESIAEDLDLSGIGRALAVTPSDEVNRLVSIHLGSTFGRPSSYQLQPSSPGRGQKGTAPHHLRGRYLFGEKGTYGELASRFGRGGEFKATPLTDEFDWQAYRSRHVDAMPLFLVEGSRLTVLDAEGEVEPKAGQMVIALTEPDR